MKWKTTREKYKRGKNWRIIYSNQSLKYFSIFHHNDHQSVSQIRGGRKSEEEEQQEETSCLSVVQIICVQ